MAASRQESRHTVTQEQGERIDGGGGRQQFDKKRGGGGGYWREKDLKTRAHRQVFRLCDALEKSDTAENLTTTRPPQRCLRALRMLTDSDALRMRL